MRYFPIAAAAALTALTALPALAEGVTTYTTDQSYDDVVFGLENAVIDKGLVIDATSYVGDMLERTRADVGSDVVLFSNAQSVSFCSATLSRKVMEEDPMNIQFCPYSIFVMRQPDSDETVIGFRQMPDGIMKEVEALLDSIARAAIGQE